LNLEVASPIALVLRAAIEFVLPAFVDSEEGCIYFQGSTAGMIGAFDFEAFVVVDAAGDFEDHSVVEEVGAGKANAVVAVGLGEMGILRIIMNGEELVYFLIEHEVLVNRLAYEMINLDVGKIYRGPKEQLVMV